MTGQYHIDLDRNIFAMLGIVSGAKVAIYGVC